MVSQSISNLDMDSAVTPGAGNEVNTLLAGAGVCGIIICRNQGDNR